MYRIILLDASDVIGKAIELQFKNMAYLSLFTDGNNFNENLTSILKSIHNEPNISTCFLIISSNIDNCFEIIKNIRQKSLYFSLPIFFSVNYNERDKEELALKMGADCTILKPFSDEKLKLLFYYFIKSARGEIDTQDISIFKICPFCRKILLKQSICCRFCQTKHKKAEQNKFVMSIFDKIFQSLLITLNNKEFKLFNIPTEIQHVQNIIRDKDPNITKLANVINRNFTLAAKITRIANSVYYKSSREIVDIKKAIVRIGLKETIKIVFTLGIKDIFKTTNKSLKIWMDDLYKHSLICATLASSLATHFSRKIFKEVIDAADIYYVGLLHDIGKLIIIQQIFRKKDLLLHAVKSGIDFDELVELLHTKIGAEVLLNWEFSEKIIFHVLRHHATEPPIKKPGEFYVLQTANFLSRISPADFDYAKMSRYLANSKINYNPEELKQVHKKVLDDVEMFYTV